MKKKSRFTALIHRGEKYFVALCPELDVVSQGKTVEEARGNLLEAVELFIEMADRSEIDQRMHGEMYVSSMEVEVG